MLRRRDGMRIDRAGAVVCSPQQRPIICGLTPSHQVTSSPIQPHYAKPRQIKPINFRWKALFHRASNVIMAVFDYYVFMMLCPKK
jgi:hypothetical protein